MEEEKDKRLPGVLLTFLFLYFYIVLRSLWDYSFMLIEWGEDHFLMHGLEDSLIALALNAVAWTYALIAVVSALTHNKGAVAALRWSVFFMLGISALELLSMASDLRALLTSTFKIFRVLFLLIFYIYLWCNKSLSAIYPKKERKLTWISMTGIIIFACTLGCAIYGGYSYSQETKYDDYFDENIAGKLRGDTLYLSCGIIRIPQGMSVDSLTQYHDLITASIKGDKIWAVAIGDLAEEKTIRQHYINCTMLRPGEDCDIFDISNATSDTIGDNPTYLTKGKVISDGDTLDWRMMSIFDARSLRTVSMALMSDSIDADSAIRKLAEHVTFGKME